MRKHVRISEAYVGYLRAIVTHFVEICRRRCLKVIGDKSKVIVLNGEEGLSMKFAWVGWCQNLNTLGVFG